MNSTFPDYTMTLNSSLPSGGGLSPITPCLGGGLSPMTPCLGGLRNVGDTCYINATLQCLFSFKSFRENIASEYTESTDVPLIAPLKRLLTHNRHSRGDSIESFVTALDNTQKDSSFDFRQQHDMNEFLMIFYDKLNTEIYEKHPNDYTNHVPHEHIMKKVTPFMKKAIDSWMLLTMKEQTWFHKMTTGQFVVQNKCGNDKCHKINHNFEPYKTLDISICSGSNPSIKNSLMEYFAMKTVNDPTETKFVRLCSKCNKSEISEQSCKLIILPEILVISLKRYDTVNNRLVKIKQGVKINSHISMNEYSITGKTETYRLKACANHVGSLGAGHYTAYSLHDKQWYKFDDNQKPKEIDGIDQINSTSVYVLFYEKILNV